LGGWRAPLGPPVTAGAASWAAVRNVPMTAAVTALTAVVGAGQLLGGGVVLALQGNRARLVDGQWWRLVTPMLVQPSGAGQYAFNLLGSVLVGVAVERQLGPGRWLAVYLGAGLAGVLTSYWWFPTQTFGGSSDAVAGLIGALTVGWWVKRSLPPWPSYLYGAFFAAYLTALAAAGVIASTIAGGLTIAAVTTVRRHGPPAWLRFLVCGLIVTCAAVLAVLRDDHGVGLTAGILGALVLGRPWQPASGSLRPER
jgi:membrane associated rhomboid family serine protease